MNGFQFKRQQRSETGTVKVVINRCFGGFGLSGEAIGMCAKLRGWTRCTTDFGMDYFLNGRGEKIIPPHGLRRDDPFLIEVVESLGENSWGDHAELKLVEVPDDVDWVIVENDGQEWVAERHRTWQ